MFSDLHCSLTEGFDPVRKWSWQFKPSKIIQAHWLNDPYDMLLDW